MTQPKRSFRDLTVTALDVLPRGTLDKVDRMGDLVIDHLCDATPEKGPWDGDPKEWCYGRLLPKTRQVEARFLDTGWQHVESEARAALEADVIKLATRVFILMDRLEMLEEKS